MPAVVPLAQFKNQSIGGSSFVSRLSPHKVPPPIPPIVTVKVSLQLVPIPLTPPPHSLGSLTSLSDTMSFLLFYHSDDFSLMESESFIQQLPSLSSTPISSPPPSSSIIISVKLSLIQDTPSNAHITSPTQSVVLSTTVRPRAPGIDCEAGPEPHP